MRADLTLPAPRPSFWLRLRPLVACAAMALALSAAFPAPGLAQSVPGADDLRALIYYLDHNDQRAVQAEMRRLRAQFPQWTPPTDVADLRAVGQTTTASVDVQPIWARLERQDYAGARALIDAARARVPSWTPDAEMLRVMETGEQQVAFDAAYSARDLNGAIAAVRRVPALMRCDRINNAWRLAELYANADQDSNAVTTYRGVLGSCSRSADAVSTLEKANEVASWDEMLQLFAVARQTAPSNSATLDQLEERLRAGRGGSAARRSSTSSSGSASTSTAAAAAAPRAPAPSTNAPVANAGIPVTRLPLRGDGRASRVRALKEQGNWGACLAESATPRSLDVLYERAWCAYNLDRTGEALAGFTAVAQRGGSLGSDVPRDSRFGMMLAYLNLNMTEEAARLAASTNLTQTQRLEVETTILDQRGVRAYLQREYGQAISYFNALQALAGNLRRDLAMLRGYSYLNNDQPQQALEEFTRLNNELSTDETRAALASVRGIMSGL